MQLESDACHYSGQPSAGATGFDFICGWAGKPLYQPGDFSSYAIIAGAFGSGQWAGHFPRKSSQNIQRLFHNENRSAWQRLGTLNRPTARHRE
jgi:hypothetical protein